MSRQQPKSGAMALDWVMAAAEQLAAIHERGTCPRELRDLGIREYRQVFFKPYVLVYRVMGGHVAAFVIAAGVHGVQSLLARRLPGA